MSDITNIEKRKFEKLFDMDSGYVCNFSNRTFSGFILDSVGIIIYTEKHNKLGDSKANRLRAFWFIENNWRFLDSRLRGNDKYKIGLPIGNLTSQIFANIYLNELDYFVKFNLREKYYFRYADDFIFLHQDKRYLENLKKIICQFVEEKLKLTVHPDKIFLQKFSQGVDFLGYVLLPYHRVLRTKTKKRMFKKVNEKNLRSYLGVLTHCQGYNLETKLKNDVWLNKKGSHFV